MDLTKPVSKGDGEEQRFGFGSNKMGEKLCSCFYSKQDFTARERNQ